MSAKIIGKVIKNGTPWDVKYDPVTKKVYVASRDLGTASDARHAMMKAQAWAASK